MVILKCKGSEYLSAMTFNLRFGLAEDGRNSWDFRKDAVQAILKEYRPDFIGFQEVNSFQDDFLKTVLCEYESIGRRSSSPERWQNNIIFFNSWTCIQSEHFYLSETPEIPSALPLSKWPRQCTIGLFRKHDKSLICVNTHFDFESSVQVRSAEIIKEKLLKYPKTLPVIVLGDFNATPESKCYEEFTSVSNNDVPLKEVFEGFHSNTFHDFTGDNLKMHIDWILYRGNISPGKREIIKNKYKSKYPSDHFPVISFFNWN